MLRYQAALKSERAYTVHRKLEPEQLFEVPICKRDPYWQLHEMVHQDFRIAVQQETRAKVLERMLRAWADKTRCRKSEN